MIARRVIRLTEEKKRKGKEKKKKKKKKRIIDLGRPTLEAYFTEINLAIECSLKAARDLPHWASKHNIDVEEDLFRIPWNFPFFLAMMPIIGVLAAGCCWVLKPSELAPSCSKLLGDLVPQYLDQRACRVTQGGVEETTALLDLKWDHIFYTGSTRITCHIAQKATAHLTWTTLELGGKCPILLDPSTDLDLAAKRILFGKSHNFRQTYVSPDYLLIPTQNDPSILTCIIESFHHAYTSFFPSDSHRLTLSRISSSTHFTHLTTLLSNMKGCVILGGHTDTTTLQMDLTMVTGVQEDDPLMSEEIFGPILPILKVRNWEEAIQIVGRVSGTPLVVYMFSEDGGIKEMVRKCMRSGSLMCNCTFLQMAVYELPYGGIGESGSGCSNKACMEEFSNIHSQIDVPTSKL
ncbi:aldehyde dehydrogenase [Desarmillaria tabescens]|uniref:Aldehyde dehydrogenase n=1 Tax=Armillaria tabescens TaxID=1929756 RepID=A0AA39MM30_ARMTA|nr:aldehyde dehydrogenase [Desarmillaria tabescens]KAK0438709.1 aldehyde dehydrogenase [Desarmillaria tabescens]